jgi:hypothetical protein
MHLRRRAGIVLFRIPLRMRRCERHGEVRCQPNYPDRDAANPDYPSGCLASFDTQPP